MGLLQDVFGQNNDPKNDCYEVPSLLSAFVDTFVDYAIGGQILGPQPIKSHNFQDDSYTNTPKSPTGNFEHQKKQDGQAIRGPTRIPAPKRLIAIGDIHGDLYKAKDALLIANVMDHQEQWIGEDTIVVQVGDLLDRGGDEIKVIYLLEKLKREACRKGGDVHIMNGNHEVLNVEGDFRYVTREGLDEFKHWADWYKMGNVLKEQCEGVGKPYDFFKDIPKNFPDGFKERMAALRPGGPITSRFLSPHPLVLVVGGNVFVHGGILPSHINYGLDRINNESQEWMEGKTKWVGPKFLHGPDSLVWLRKFSKEKASLCDCNVLEKSLASVPGAKRMVMGHTMQQYNGINGVCGYKAVRVDVGMSQGCLDHHPEVLEIRNDQVVTVLFSSPSELDGVPYMTRGQRELQSPVVPPKVQVPAKVPLN